jgi:hypothetical protein
MSVGGSLGALHFFGYLKRALELLTPVPMSPPTILYDNWVDTIPLGKKNKQTRIRYLSSGKKIQNSTFLQIGA